jgi:hypothetical protein
MVGVLVVCGYDPDEALETTRRAIQKAVTGGWESGSAAGWALVESTLLGARAPKKARKPEQPLEHVLEALSFSDRMATVLPIVPGIPRAGPGRPEQVAEAVGAQPPRWDTVAVPGRPSLSDVVKEAVQKRACPPEPDLVAEARAAARRQRVVMVVVGVAAIIVLGLLIAALFG